MFHYFDSPTDVDDAKTHIRTETAQNVLQHQS